MKEFMNDTINIVKIIHKMSKACFPVSLVKNILERLLPFVSIIYSARILDGLTSSLDKQTILQDVYWMIGLNLVGGLIIALLTRSFEISKETINMRVKEEIASKALQIDYQQMETKENMELLNKALEGSRSSGGLGDFCNSVGLVISSIISIVYAIYLLSGLFLKVSIKTTSNFISFLNSPISGIIFIACFFIAIILNYYFMQRINKKSYKFFENNVAGNRIFSYYGSIIKNYDAQKDIRIYSMQEMLNHYMAEYHKDSFTLFTDFCQLQSSNTSYAIVVNQTMLFLGYIFTGLKAIVGIISIGSVVKYVNALSNVSTAINQIIQSYADIDLQRNYLKNYFNFLSLKSEKYNGELPTEKREDSEYELEFRNVSFHYPNSEELILKNVSFKMPIGKKMAIVGKNGAGKTTFIKLLCRLYDPSVGEILLNGIDIKKYDYQEYLDLFSVVFQDFKLFSLGVGENIATTQDYNQDKVWQTLDKTGVKDRVERMKEQLNTQLYQTDKEGIEISGGEAQKIAISRALYKDAPIVILDEPTSALDPISEYEIYANFNDLVKNKTSIYISHRMSSCRFCDVITVFDDGCIIQSGNHEELIKDKNGLYYQLWNAQAKNYN